MSVVHLAGRLFAALWMCAPSAPAGPPADALAVHMHIEFDRSISSHTIKRLTTTEATAIWREYGVELQWNDGGAEPALCLAAVVERYHQSVKLDRAPVLGRTTIGREPPAHEPIRISLDALDAVLDQQSAEHLPLRDREVATALGRVLAHEVGHVLLGSPGYHDREGLMRAMIPTDDLVRMDRSRLRLMNRSVVRLRARIASLAAEGRPSDTCMNPIESEGER
jgi:hypothetical protein